VKDIGQMQVLSNVRGLSTSVNPHGLIQKPASPQSASDLQYTIRKSDLSRLPGQYLVTRNSSGNVFQIEITMGPCGACGYDRASAQIDKHALLLPSAD